MSYWRTSELYLLPSSEVGDFLKKYEYPWLCLADIKGFVKAMCDKYKDSEEYVVLSSDVVAHKSARIAKSAYIGSPCFIAEGAEIRHSAYIRSAAYVGVNSVVGNSTELKNCILIEKAEVPHFNYVGDSVLGTKSHLGAGAVTSNVKSDRSNVTVKVGGENFLTGRYKVGAFLGDGAEVGCNSTLCPGTVIGRGASVYPCVRVRGGVAPDTILKSENISVKRKEI